MELWKQNFYQWRKRKKNGSVKKGGKQAFKRSIYDRKKYYPNFATEFGHFEGDTIVEKETKATVTLKPKNRTAKSIEERLDEWLAQLPIKFVKTITFDCGKEFSNWKNLCNKYDISIFFADPGCPSQRG